MSLLNQALLGQHRDVVALTDDPTWLNLAADAAAETGVLPPYHPLRSAQVLTSVDPTKVAALVAAGLVPADQLADLVAKPAWEPHLDTFVAALADLSPAAAARFAYHGRVSDALRRRIWDHTRIHRRSQARDELSSYFHGVRGSAGDTVPVWLANDAVALVTKDRLLSVVGRADDAAAVAQRLLSIHDHTDPRVFAVAAVAHDFTDSHRRRLLARTAGLPDSRWTSYATTLLDGTARTLLEKVLAAPDTAAVLDELGPPRRDLVAAELLAAVSEGTGPDLATLLDLLPRLEKHASATTCDQLWAVTLDGMSTGQLVSSHARVSGRVSPTLRARVYGELVRRALDGDRAALTALLSGATGFDADHDLARKARELLTWPQLRGTVTGRTLAADALLSLCTTHGPHAGETFLTLLDSHDGHLADLESAVAAASVPVAS